LGAQKNRNSKEVTKTNERAKGEFDRAKRGADREKVNSGKLVVGGREKGKSSIGPSKKGGSQFGEEIHGKRAITRTK